jgi:LysR family nitrogen assimilation transcriptional regulator
MDIRQLKYFLAVADAGGFLRAAQLIHIAQPSLSTHVSKLEAELEVKLFTRTSRGAELTSAGRILVERARQIIRDIEATRQAVKNLSGNLYGEVSIGLPPTISDVVTIPLLKAVKKALPTVTLRFVEGQSKWLLEWLVSGRIDGAILFGVASRRGLTMTPLLDEDLFMVSPAEKRGKRQLGSFEFRNLRNYPVLLSTVGSPLRTILDRAVSVSGFTLDVAAELDGVLNLKKAVAAGLGHAVLPASTICGEVVNHKLVARRIVNPKLSRTVVFASRADRNSASAQTQVRDILISLMRDFVRSGYWKAVLRI